MENGNFKEQNLIEFCLHKYSKQTENYFLNWRKIQRMTKTRRGGAEGGGEGYEVKLRLLFIPLFFPPEKTQRQSEEKVFLCFYFQLYHSSSYLRILLFVDSVSNRGRNLCAMVSFPSFQMLSIKFAVKEAEKQ